jgi:putative ABC transport system permease protein
MAMTLLAVGGGTFMTALNVSKGWDSNLKRIDEQRFYDIDVRLHRQEPDQLLMQSLERNSGLECVELWNYAPTAPVGETSYRIVDTYPDKGHGSFFILGVPPATRLIRLPVTQGRWLDSTGTNDVVLNHMAQVRFPTVRIGDSILLSLDNIATRWRIVGIAEDLYSPATAYVPAAAFREEAGLQGRANMIRARFDRSSPGSHASITRAIEETYIRSNVSIYQSIPASLFRNAIAEHMTVLINSLLAMAALVGLVGIIGLASTVSMNLLERTREMGVLKAIGARPGTIQRIVMLEALAIGLTSVAFAFCLSMLTSYVLGMWIGNMAFRSPLALTVSAPGVIGWTAITVCGTIVAAYYPARRASRLTTREALGYG